MGDSPNAVKCYVLEDFMKKIILFTLVALCATALSACNGDYAPSVTPVAPVAPAGERPISEHGWQAAADFLSPFTSLFTGVGRMETVWDAERHVDVPTGRFLMGWDNVHHQPIFADETPEFYFGHTDTGTPTFFDRQGNRITEAPWAYIQRFEGFYTQYGEPTVSYSHHYANYFKLFDFDHDGIPEIFIHFQQTFEGCYGGFYRIFSYVDGEYKMLDMVAFLDGEPQAWVFFGSVHELFTDADGRIITFVDNGLFTGEYTQLVLTESRAEFHHLADAHNWDAWQAHHWQVWEGTLIDSWLFHNPTLFGTDIAITPLLPFEDVGAELYAYLQQHRQDGAN